MTLRILILQVVETPRTSACLRRPEILPTELEMASRPEHAHQYEDITIGRQAKVHLGDYHEPRLTGISASTSMVGTNQVAQTLINNYHPGPAGRSTKRVVELQADLKDDAPKPFMIVPFRPNRDFIVRPEFSILWDRKHERGSSLAIVGLGGVGKSHIANEFVHRYHQEEPDVWIFWIHASSAARFEQSYRQVAESLRIPGRHDPQIDICLQVKVWLSEPKHGSWVMVLDNADDQGIVLGAGEENIVQGTTRNDIPLSSHLPSSPGGLTIVTTRSWKCARRLVVYDDNIIDLGPMPEALAVQMLESRLRRQSLSSTASELTQLAEQLDYMPLAISQAAAYITNRAPRMSVTQYLQNLQQSEEQRLKLLKAATYDYWRDEQAQESIIMTWYQSFEHIRRQQASASRLLSLMSFFDRDGIPEDLLVNHYKEQEGNSGDEDDTFEDDIAILRDFCLIEVSAFARTFEMHRLVQLSTRRWLDISQEIERWQRRYIEILEKHFPLGDLRTWPLCQALYPHVTEMKILPSMDVSTQKLYATVLYRAAHFGKLHGLYAQAMTMAQTSCDMFTKLSGAADVETLASMNTLGEVLLAQGRHADAETVLRRVMILRKEKLGEDDPEALESATWLGRALQAQAKHSDAQEIHQRALERSIDSLGPAHPRSLTSMYDLACILQAQGNFPDAETHHRKALAQREHVLGPDHPETLASTSQLGRLLQARAKYGEAQDLHQRALEGRERLLGHDHPHTLASVHNLGRVLQARGKYEQALTMHQRVYTDRIQKLGADHPDTLASVSNLGRVLQAQGRYVKAEEMHRRAVEGRLRKLGAAHPYTLASLNNLGCVLQAQTKHAEAEEIHERAYQGRLENLGVDHPDTLSSLVNIGILLQGMQEYVRAESAHRQALLGREQKLGKDHRQTLTSAWCLASTLAAQHKWVEACEYHQRALKGLQNQLDDSHPRLIECEEQFAALKGAAAGATQ